MISLSNELKAILTSNGKIKEASGGWTSFNGNCCSHNGEGRNDTRKRAGVKIDNDVLAYHCFNCGFKVVYKPGQPLSVRLRKLLTWYGASENTVQRLVLEALREKERYEALGKLPPPKEELVVNFKPYELPEESVSFFALVEFYELQNNHDNTVIPYPPGFVEAVSYVSNRCINMREYEFYWSSSTSHKMQKRVIIPFYWKNEIIGYTARSLDDAIKPKYLMEVDEGFVFNIDKQDPKAQFVIVCEGAFDAMSVDGVAVLHNTVSKKQADIIENLDKDIIVVPDFEQSGNNLVDCAIENQWAVSFPPWAEHCKDINDAVIKYGKLFVLKTIIDHAQRSKIKIQLMRKKYVK